jgi:hypothetical protein
MMVSYNYNVIGGGLLFRVGMPSLGLLAAAVTAYIIYDALNAVPPEHRKGITPNQVWLLLIPIFNLVWSFIVFQRLSESFQSYFEANGRPQPGDYARGLGLAFSILLVITHIPCLGCFTILPTLILLVLTLVKISSYKSLIVNGGGGAFPM